MLDGTGIMRKSRRIAAIEAAKKIKKNADANKLSDHYIKEEYQLYEVKMVKQHAVVATDNEDANNTMQPKSHKRKALDHIDFAHSGLEAQLMHDISKKTINFVEANPPENESMPKRRRGRPSKSQIEKCLLTWNKRVKYEDSYIGHNKEVDHDVNLRRESYNSSLVKNEPMVAPVSCGRKQLHPVSVNRGHSYMESLMKFSKDLGPTARRVAHRMLLGRGIRSSNAPRLMDMASSINGSIDNTNTNQASQKVINFQDSSSNLDADYKGKKIMVDDWINNSNKWEFEERKEGVKIYDGTQENIGFTRGNDSTQYQEFVNNNLTYGQVGNQRITNQFGSFPLNYNGILNHNINKITGNEDIRVVKEGIWNAHEPTPTNVKQNSRVYPSTYLPPSKTVSSSILGLGGGVGSIPRIQSCPPLAQPPQNWRLTPPMTNNQMVANDFRQQGQELQLPLGSYMQTRDQESSVCFQNSWAQNKPIEPHNEQPRQRQVLSYPNLFGNNNASQQQLWSQMAMLGAINEQDSLSFGTQQDFDVQMLNILQNQPQP